MAGAGYKLFNTGDVLTAAQVNTYLQEQVVMVFANAAARTTALSAVLAEGMVSYLKDTNATEVYDGSAWVGIGNSGDITGVTAGTGISGGGTSGTVTITNDMATTITAAGDIVVGTGSGTYDNLPIGTTGQVLTADTTVSPYKVKWASAASGGGYTLLSTTSLSGTTTTVSSISGSYKHLYVEVAGVTWSGTVNDSLKLSTNHTSAQSYIRLQPSGIYSDYLNTDLTYIDDGSQYFTGDNGNNFTCWTIYNYASSSEMKTWIFHTLYKGSSSNGRVTSRFGGIYSTTAVNQINVSTQGGLTLNGGTVRIYGVN